MESNVQLHCKNNTYCSTKNNDAIHQHPVCDDCHTAAPTVSPLEASALGVSDAPTAASNKGGSRRPKPPIAKPQFDYTYCSSKSDDAVHQHRVSHTYHTVAPTVSPLEASALGVSHAPAADSNKGGSRRPKPPIARPQFDFAFDPHAGQSVASGAPVCYTAEARPFNLLSDIHPIHQPSTPCPKNFRSASRRPEMQKEAANTSCYFYSAVATYHLSSSIHKTSCQTQVNAAGSSSEPRPKVRRHKAVATLNLQPYDMQPICRSSGTHVRHHMQPDTCKLPSNAHGIHPPMTPYTKNLNPTCKRGRTPREIANITGMSVGHSCSSKDTLKKTKIPVRCDPTHVQISSSENDVDTVIHPPNAHTNESLYIQHNGAPETSNQTKGRKRGASSRRVSAKRRCLVNLDDHVPIVGQTSASDLGGSASTHVQTSGPQNVVETVIHPLNAHTNESVHIQHNGAPETSNQTKGRKRGAGSCRVSAKRRCLANLDDHVPIVGQTSASDLSDSASTHVQISGPQNGVEAVIHPLNAHTNESVHTQHIAAAEASNQTEARKRNACSGRALAKRRRLTNSDNHVPIVAEPSHNQRVRRASLQHCQLTAELYPNSTGHRQNLNQPSTSSTSQDTSPAYDDLGDCTERCRHCNAAFWYGERLKGNDYRHGSPAYHLCYGGVIPLLPFLFTFSIIGIRVNIYVWNPMYNCIVKTILIAQLKIMMLYINILCVTTVILLHQACPPWRHLHWEFRMHRRLLLTKASALGVSDAPTAASNKGGSRRPKPPIARPQFHYTHYSSKSDDAVHQHRVSHTYHTAAPTVSPLETSALGVSHAPAADSNKGGSRRPKPPIARPQFDFAFHPHAGQSVASGLLLHSNELHRHVFYCAYAYFVCSNLSQVFSMLSFLMVGAPVCYTAEAQPFNLLSDIHPIHQPSTPCPKNSTSASRRPHMQKEAANTSASSVHETSCQTQLNAAGSSSEPRLKVSRHKAVATLNLQTYDMQPICRSSGAHVRHHMQPDTCNLPSNAHGIHPPMTPYTKNLNPNCKRGRTPREIANITGISVGHSCSSKDTLEKTKIPVRCDPTHVQISSSENDVDTVIHPPNADTNESLYIQHNGAPETSNQTKGRKRGATSRRVSAKRRCLVNFDDHVPIVGQTSASDLGGSASTHVQTSGPQNVVEAVIHPLNAHTNESVHIQHNGAPETSNQTKGRKRGAGSCRVSAKRRCLANLDDHVPIVGQTSASDLGDSASTHVQISGPQNGVEAVIHPLNAHTSESVHTQHIAAAEASNQTEARKRNACSGRALAKRRRLTNSDNHVPIVAEPSHNQRVRRASLQHRQLTAELHPNSTGHRQNLNQPSTSSTSQDTSPAYDDLGDCTERCRHCNAAFWYGERLKGNDYRHGSPAYHLCCGGDDHNELVRIFRTARDKCAEADVPEFKVRLYSGASERGYELPTSQTLGAIVFDCGPESESNYDVILEYRDGPLRRISKLHKSYMSLQFPLIFIYGQPGFYPKLMLKTSDPDDEPRRVTMNAYYTYQLHPKHATPPSALAITSLEGVPKQNEPKTGPGKAKRPLFQDDPQDTKTEKGMVSTPLPIPNEQDLGIRSINNLSCGCASTAAATSGEVIKEEDDQVLLIEPLKVNEIKGICSKWVWRGYTINYLKYEGLNGGDKLSPPVLLVHGFGASVAHWRRYKLLICKYHSSNIKRSLLALKRNKTKEECGINNDARDKAFFWIVISGFW
ncbi:helitron helicase-like domain-containing protein [Artemisia annua]|uniref:Helitron helicase-like domain-containing protein n=1 Tax=Artemisia annua TaxID=35608 RepID=A0A2U1P3M7_ARTAN|nr:helitron helicase-like domain-containing protein [Artemisia annua]